MMTIDDLTSRMIEIGKRLKIARETAGLSISQATVLYLKHVGLAFAPYPNNVTVIKTLENGIDITALEIVLLGHIYGASEIWLLTGMNPNLVEKKVAGNSGGLYNANNQWISTKEWTDNK